MSSDDTDTADSEHSDPDEESTGGTGSDGQPRDPETGQFLPKDERGGTTDGDEEGDEGSSGTGSESESGAETDSAESAAATEPAASGGATDEETARRPVPGSRERAPSGRSSTANASVGPRQEPPREASDVALRVRAPSRRHRAVRRRPEPRRARPHRTVRRQGTAPEPRRPVGGAAPTDRESRRDHDREYAAVDGRERRA
ncbi:hypothetical protein ACFQL4_29045 [Halosimplex aquaticum]